MPVFEDEEVVDTEDYSRLGAAKLRILAQDEEDEEELLEGRNLWEVGFEIGEERARNEILAEGDWYE